MKHLLAAAAFAAAVLSPALAQSSYNGRIWLVQSTGSPPNIRFFTEGTATTRISLYATGDHEVMLLEAFYRKARVSVGYAPLVPCPSGISGACGTVNSVTVYMDAF